MIGDERTNAESHISPLNKLSLVEQYFQSI